MKPANQECPSCGVPMIITKRARRKPEAICINTDCPLKELTTESKEVITKIDKGLECPDCGQKLAVRKSAYGTFIGCTAYPKCKYLKQLDTKQSAQVKQ